MMIFVNQAEKTGLTKDSYLMFVTALAPFAPHITEEIWAEQGGEESLHKRRYPEVDITLLKDSEVTIGVQVNGKLRGTVTVAPEAAEAEVVEIALENKDIMKYMDGKTPKKVVYVPGKILSLIIAP
jgi:leucyl-tRNA synthetase